VINPVLALVGLLVCYLIGAFPTAYLIGRLNSVDIFAVGSGNMGTTNAIRAMGLKWGLLVWAIDIAKGVIAVAVATVFLPNGPAQVVGAIAAIVGHNWSIFAAIMTGRIRGGKGAATWLGTFLMMAPAPVIAVVAVLFTLIIWLTRYVSLAVLISVATGAFAMALLAISQIESAMGLVEMADVYMLYGVVAAIIIFYRHRSNIQRLLTGTERRLGDRV
jgi:glycerol-3-phosphate acyltransferase PlsY